MKRLFLTCAAFGVLFSFIAWLLGILLIDVFIGRDDWMSHDLDVLSEMEHALNTSDDVEATAAILANQYSATLETINLENSPEYSESYDLMDSYYDITLNDGTTWEVGLGLPDLPFITTADLLQLLLHTLAIISAVWVSLIVVERQLRPLGSAARSINPIKEDSPQHTETAEPIPNAITALNTARDQIAELKEAEAKAIGHHRDLLASVAHEFRNPLARLQFAIELASESNGEDQLKLFEEANVAAVELDSLVRETLHYSRLINNGNSLSLDNVSIIDVFRTVSDLQPGTRPDVRLILDYPQDEILLRADKRLLTRALTNLVTNALKYANTEVVVSVGTLGSKALINVIDDGDGIDQLQAERIFEPFYRIERSRSRDTGGFGLGLSIVNSICEQHSATVNLQATERGAHFLLTWPLSQSDS